MVQITYCSKCGGRISIEDNTVFCESAICTPPNSIDWKKVYQEQLAPIFEWIRNIIIVIISVFITKSVLLWYVNDLSNPFKIWIILLVYIINGILVLTLFGKIQIELWENNHNFIFWINFSILAGTGLFCIIMIIEKITVITTGFTAVNLMLIVGYMFCNFAYFIDDWN